MTVIGDRADLVNCPTIATESNLWVVRLGEEDMEAVGDVRLGRADLSDDAVFAFDVEATSSGDSSDVLVTTEHSALWVVDTESLSARVAPSEPGFDRGAAMTVHPGRGLVMVAGTELRAFDSFP